MSQMGNFSRSLEPGETLHFMMNWLYVFLCDYVKYVTYSCKFWGVGARAVLLLAAFQYLVLYTSDSPQNYL